MPNGKKGGKKPSKKKSEDNYRKSGSSPMSTSSVKKNPLSKSGNRIPAGVSTYRGVKLKGAPSKKKK